MLQECGEERGSGMMHCGVNRGYLSNKLPIKSEPQWLKISNSANSVCSSSSSTTGSGLSALHRTAPRVLRGPIISTNTAFKNEISRVENDILHLLFVYIERHTSITLLPQIQLMIKKKDKYGKFSKLLISKTEFDTFRKQFVTQPYRTGRKTEISAVHTIPISSLI
jgi:hypothetical protein